MDTLNRIAAAIGGMLISLVCILLDAIKERPPGPDVPPDQRFRDVDGQ